MLVCGECGHHNSDQDTFCGSCGRFLEWNAQRLDPAPRPSRPEPDESPDPRVGFLDRLRGLAVEVISPGPVMVRRDPEQPAGRPLFPPPTGTVAPPPTLGSPPISPPPPGRASVPPPPPGRAPVPPPSPGRPPLSPPPPPPGHVPPPPPPPSAPPPVAARLVVPVVHQEPDEVIPQTVRQRTAPTRPSRPTEKLRPGDLVCGDCGEGNNPARKFCRRCGHSLASAAAVRPPWWRRLRRKRVLEAGTRPARPGDGRGTRFARSAIRRGRAILSVGVLVFGLLAGFYPPLRTLVGQQVTAVKQRIQGLAETALTPIRPVAVQGPAPDRSHPAKAAFDTYTTTFWAAAWSERKPPVLTVQLDHPVALRKLIVRSGDPKNFTARSRPAVLRLSYSNEKSELITLADTPDPQELALTKAVGVGQFTITVISVHQAPGADAFALAEVELFGLG